MLSHGTWESKGLGFIVIPTALGSFGLFLVFFAFVFVFALGSFYRVFILPRQDHLVSREKRGAGKDKRGSFEALVRPAWGG